MITQENVYKTAAASGGSPKYFTIAQWRAGLSNLLRALQVPGMRRVFLGNTPALSESGPLCIATHHEDLQDCSVSAESTSDGYDYVEQSTVRANGAEYVNVFPWFCATKCTAVIQKYSVYIDPLHISASWALYIQNVLADSIGLPQRSTSTALPVRGQ